jgi:hypothetical protein
MYVQRGDKKNLAPPITTRSHSGKITKNVFLLSICKLGAPQDLSTPSMRLGHTPRNNRLHKLSYQEAVNFFWVRTTEKRFLAIGLLVKRAQNF